MNKQTFFKTSFVLILALLLFTCNKKEKKGVDPAFKAYITAFTSGTISSQTPIRIVLINDAVKPVEIGTTLEKKVFEFSPAISGNAIWVDERTIEFRPSTKMEAGREYSATFHLSQVINVPSNFSDFDFSFQIIRQSFEVNIEGLHPIDNRNFNRQFLTGNITTADVAGGDETEKTLSATQNSKQLPIRWSHNEDGLVHGFTVDSIIRTDDSSLVILSWDGKPLNVDLAGSDTVTVHALGNFVLTDTRVVQQETDQYLVLQFSDPLDETQNLQGLITLGGMTDMRFTIEGNTIRVYPSSRQTSSLTLTIEPSLKNALGKQLAEKIEQNILFEEIKPSVKLSGKGVILPGTTGLMFPFEAVNLSAVDVKIVKIFSDNVTQFLQVNSLETNNEITRVGRVVYNKSVSLASLKQTDFTKWNKYALDLSDFIKADPGSIYKVTISFRKKYSLYRCTEADSSDDVIDNSSDQWDNLDEKENSSWDYVEEYFSEYDEDGNTNYQWSNRDNPCKKEYYTANRFVSRNVLASDLGLIAKKGVDGSLFFSVTDLKTANPIAGVNIEVYNLQRQIIKKLVTNSDGLAEVSLTEKPFLMVAKKGDQRGYLKLDDGSSLSLSMFDVSGEKVQKGIKGFIYGERGVWRPGDSLFVTFILEDKQHALPDGHPVSFELFNPLGQLDRRMISTTSMNGFYSFHCATDEDAPTGNWEAKVKVGNAVFSKSLRIETVMPNRLKIKFDFAKKFLDKDETQSAQMEVHWLHGAIAKNLKANVEVTLSAMTTSFPKYSEYSFDDPTRKFSADKQQIFEGQLNELGIATVTSDIEVEDAAPGMLQANFVTKVFEPGGNFSIDRFSMPYHPFSSYTGIRIPPGDKARGMLLTDTNHTVTIVSVDKNGNPIQGKRKIEIEFYKVQWKWWWDKSAEDLSDYNASRWQQLLKRDTLTLNNGEAKWTMRLNFPEWGRYLLVAHDVESGHRSGKLFYMDWPGWAGRGQRDNQGGGATMLTFASDKDKYMVGDEAVLTIPTSTNSRALISIESGTRILKTDWLISGKGSSQYRFKITPDMSPNIYVNVTLLQPHSQTINDLPIRMYGVLPLLVENPGTHLTPIIKMPDVLKPESPFTVSVREEKGKAMTYTLAVVDEGLLDLTRFKTPDAWNNFYAREALGVKTWDMFDNVMGAWGASLERILSIGGDEGLTKPKEGKKANRFPPVVKFLGPFHLNKGETASHTITMPQYIGSVRTMVIAGDDGAYGFAEKATPVRKPLMILATIPRVLGPDEITDIPVTVFALEKHVKDVNIEIIPGDIFISEKQKMQSLHFNQAGDDLVSFRLKVKSMTGTGRVKIIATSGKERAETSVELNVMNRNPRIVDVIDSVIDPGQKWNGSYKPIGVAGTNKVTLELSSIPPLNLGKRLDYLIHYPYGCVEQTTSSAFPQLYLSDLIDLSPAKKSAIESNIKLAIDRLRLFQQPSGGMGYWPGDHEENDWATNYAGHFLIEAELKGFTLPAGFMDQWKKYQRNKSTSWTYTDAPSMLTQSYRLYTLALLKSPELGSMNRLKENKNLTTVAKWSLAAAYQLAGQTEIANQLIANLPIAISDYKELSETYGSDERDKSIILETLSLLEKRSLATPIMKQLSAALCSHDWMSTQTTAYTLMAMSKYLGRTRLKSEMSYSYSINNSAEIKESSQAAIKQVETKLRGTSTGLFGITNTSKSVLFARVILEGVPATDDQVASQSGLEMKVVYKTIEGKDIDPTNVSQGTDFYAEVSITNPATKIDYAEMALTQMFPSGWEIMNSRLDQSDNSIKTSVPKYQDIRDDRVNTFFDLKSKETKTFRVYVNASYLGKYYLPVISCEAMYNASINARQPGRWVNVTSEEKVEKALSKK